MLDDALADFVGEIQSAKCGVTELEVLDDPERVKIMVEGESVLAHGIIESLFARMAKRRMTNVVHQGERLYQVTIESELSGDGPRDLRDLDGVGQPIAKMIGI